jgi:hypothetical protein
MVDVMQKKYFPDLKTLAELAFNLMNQKIKYLLNCTRYSGRNFDSVQMKKNRNSTTQLQHDDINITSGRMLTNTIEMTFYQTLIIQIWD